MKLAYCPECAAPLHMETRTKYVCANNHKYFNNPKVGVNVVVLKGDQVLFIKRANEPGKGKYDFPGGFVDYGEDGWQAAIREVKEEAGIEVKDLVILDSTNQLYEENITVCDIIFATTAWTGEIAVADDAASFAWLPIETINSTAFAWNYPRLVEKLQEFRDA